MWRSKWAIRYLRILNRYYYFFLFGCLPLRLVLGPRVIDFGGKSHVVLYCVCLNFNRSSQSNKYHLTHSTIGQREKKPPQEPVFICRILYVYFFSMIGTQTTWLMFWSAIWIEFGEHFCVSLFAPCAWFLWRRAFVTFCLMCCIAIWVIPVFFLLFLARSDVDFFGKTSMMPGSINSSAFK